MEKNKRRRLPKLPRVTVVGDGSVKGTVAEEIKNLRALGGIPTSQDEVDNFRRRANIKQQTPIKIAKTNVGKKIVWRHESKRGDYDRNPHEIEQIRSEQAYQISLNKIERQVRLMLNRHIQLPSGNKAKVLELAKNHAIKGRNLVKFIMKGTSLSESGVRKILNNEKLKLKSIAQNKK